jgi:hypothetical protein
MDMNGEEKYHKPSSRRTTNALFTAMMFAEAMKEHPENYEITGLQGNSDYTPSQLKELERKRIKKLKKLNQ